MTFYAVFPYRFPAFIVWNDTMKGRGWGDYPFWR